MDPAPNPDIQLTQAAWLGRREAMAEALRLGARVDALDASGQSALMLAARAGHVECVEDLMRAGANPEQRDARHRTVAMAAIHASQPQALAALLAAGADKNAQNAAGWTLAMMCIHNREMRGLRALDEAGLNNLQALDAGEPGQPRWSALMMAADNGWADGVELMLRAGADPDQANDKGWTAAHLAAASNQLRVVARLAEHGADLGRLNADGRRPVDYAREGACKEAIQAWMQAKALGQASAEGAALLQASSQGRARAKPRL